MKGSGWRFDCLLSVPQVTQAKIKAGRERTEALLKKRRAEQEQRMEFKRATQREKEALLRELQGRALLRSNTGRGPGGSRETGRKPTATARHH